MRTALVIPSIRKDSLRRFVEEWKDIIDEKDIVVVDDTGDIPAVVYRDRTFSLEVIMGEDKDLISNKCAAVRNLGFAFVCKYLDVDYVYTADDDMYPKGNTLQDHINILSKKVPTSWFPVSEIHSNLDYTRGFPYKIRNEAPVMVSHGVWYANPDYDAPTQLVKGNEELKYLKCTLPKGLFSPICGMNVAFNIKALPYAYYAPVGDYKGAERFDDIWMGLELKKDMDKKGWAIATGYAECYHVRESNVFKNLAKEAVGIEKNEEYWKGEHDQWYKSFMKKRKRWIKLLKSWKHI